MKATIATSLALMFATAHAFAADCTVKEEHSGVGGANVVYTLCYSDLFASKLFSDKDRQYINKEMTLEAKTMSTASKIEQIVWSFYSPMLTLNNPQIGQKKLGLNFGDVTHTYAQTTCKDFNIYHMTVVPMNVVVMDKRMGVVIPPAFEAYRSFGFLCKSNKNPNLWETIEQEDYYAMRKSGAINSFIPGGTEGMIEGEE